MVVLIFFWIRIALSKDDGGENLPHLQHVMANNLVEMSREPILFYGLSIMANLNATASRGNAAPFNEVRLTILVNASFLLRFMPHKSDKNQAVETEHCQRQQIFSRYGTRRPIRKGRKESETGDI